MGMKSVGKENFDKDKDNKISPKELEDIKESLKKKNKELEKQVVNSGIRN